MSQQTKKGSMYRMPMHFGPMAGPRQGPDGEKFEWTDTPKRTLVSLSFLSDPERLDAILPPGFTVEGEPVVTIEIQYLTELEWLAGRGYNTIGVKFPARFRGRRDEAVGSFLAILWENLADPIISGRDELGFSKLYCEIPSPIILRGRHSYRGLWLEHKFLDVELWDLTEDALPASPPGVRNDGILHYKYIPSTQSWGEADVAYAALTPGTGSKATIKRAWRGQGRHTFYRSTWEQLPTMFHIVNALRDLPVLENRGASIVESQGGKDLSDQRRLD